METPPLPYLRRDLMTSLGLMAGLVGVMLAVRAVLA